MSLRFDLIFNIKLVALHAFICWWYKRCVIVNMIYNCEHDSLESWFIILFCLWLLNKFYWDDPLLPYFPLRLPRKYALVKRWGCLIKTDCEFIRARLWDFFDDLSYFGVYLMLVSGITTLHLYHKLSEVKLHSENWGSCTWLLLDWSNQENDCR